VSTIEHEVMPDDENISMEMQTYMIGEGTKKIRVRRFIKDRP
jgi:hypothetical protein